MPSSSVKGSQELSDLSPHCVDLEPQSPPLPQIGGDAETPPHMGKGQVQDAVKVMQENPIRSLEAHCTVLPLTAAGLSGGRSERSVSPGCTVTVPSTRLRHTH